MISTENKCVAAFYRIDDDAIFENAFDVIWGKFVAPKLDDVNCSNVFEYDLDAMALAGIFVDGALGRVMRLDMQSELDAGATYVFLKPVVGDPVAGFALAKLLAH